MLWSFSIPISTRVFRRMRRRPALRNTDPTASKGAPESQRERVSCRDFISRSFICCYLADAIIGGLGEIADSKCSLLAGFAAMTAGQVAFIYVPSLKRRVPFEPAGRRFVAPFDRCGIRTINDPRFREGARDSPVSIRSGRRTWKAEIILQGQ